jgi:FkbM family methyltransferase
MINIIQTEDKGYGSFIVILNDLIGRFINKYGFWEIHLYTLYKLFLKDTDVVLDAGANIGFHTVHMAKSCKKVYAFEPQPLIYNILSTNILFNDLSNKVEHYRLGLGDKEETLKMAPIDNFDEKDGTKNYGGRNITKDSDGEEEVKVVVFDSLNIDIDAIKIDVQGFETEAFNGMVNTLKRCKPWIMLENYMDSEKDQAVLIFLKELGYEIYRPVENNLPMEDCLCIVKDEDKHNNIKNIIEEQLSTVYRKL